MIFLDEPRKDCFLWKEMRVACGVTRIDCICEQGEENE